MALGRRHHRMTPGGRQARRCWISCSSPLLGFRGTCTSVHGSRGEKWWCTGPQGRRDAGGWPGWGAREGDTRAMARRSAHGAGCVPQRGSRRSRTSSWPTLSNPTPQSRLPGEWPVPIPPARAETSGVGCRCWPSDAPPRQSRTVRPSAWSLRCAWPTTGPHVTALRVGRPKKHDSWRVRCSDSPPGGWFAGGLGRLPRDRARHQGLPAPRQRRNARPAGRASTNGS